ncbi:MAG: alpha/beta hydrolase [Polyangia bacterium]
MSIIAFDLARPPRNRGKEMRMKFGSLPRSILAVLVMFGLGAACSSSGGTTPSASGGTQSASGGAAQGGSAAGGKVASGGTAGTSSASGGSSGSGGAISAGGASGAGGATHTGGVSLSGGVTGSGGAAGASGGAGGPAKGGATASGGASGIGSGGSPAPELDGGGSDALPAAVPSAGCGTQGKATLIAGGQPVPNGLTTSLQLTINSANGGGQRQYVIDIPADYDATHPYRLIFSWHQAYGSDVDNATGVYPANNGPNFNATDYAFFGLHREMTAANDTAIFVAPEGIGAQGPWDFTRDSALFDDMLALFETDLCIDQSRVFATGFSFGAMMSYALSITRQTKLRAVVTMEAANYNLPPNEPTDSNAAPIAYMGTTGMSDTLCPWTNGTSTTEGGKYCDLTHATDNGCDTSAAIPTTTPGSKTYLCYDFPGCKAGYPVKVCTFDGAHTPASVDDGSNTGDDGLKAFVPPIAWKFITQF